MILTLLHLHFYTNEHLIILIIKSQHFRQVIVNIFFLLQRNILLQKPEVTIGKKPYVKVRL